MRLVSEPNMLLDLHPRHGDPSSPIQLSTKQLCPWLNRKPTETALRSTYLVIGDYDGSGVGSRKGYEGNHWTGRFLWGPDRRSPPRCLGEGAHRSADTRSPVLPTLDISVYRLRPVNPPSLFLRLSLLRFIAIPASPSALINPLLLPLIQT